MKILLLDWGNEPLMKVMHRELNALHHEVKRLPIRYETSFAEVKSEISGFTPDFCFTNVYYVFQLWLPRGLELEAYLEKQNIPVGAWMFDSPLASGSQFGVYRFQNERIPQNVLFLCMDQENQRWLLEQGARAAYFPLAFDRDLAEKPSSPELLSRYSHALSFVGRPFSPDAPMANRDAMLDYFFYRILSEFAAYLQSFAESKSITDLKPSSHEALTLLFQSLAPEFEIFLSHRYTNASDYRIAMMRLSDFMREKLSAAQFSVFQTFQGCLDIIYSNFQMADYLSELRPLGLRIFGGEDWSQKIFPDSKDLSPRLSQEELVAVFRASKINFCYTKWQFRDAAAERGFLIYGVGGFPLLDYRESLNTIYQQGEYVAYQSIDEAKDLIRYYLKDEAARNAIIEKGRARILSEHTYAHRARELIQIVKNEFQI